MESQILDPLYLSSLYIFFTLFLLSLPISLPSLIRFTLHLISFFLPSLSPIPLQLPSLSVPKTFFFLPSHPLHPLFLPSLSIFHSSLFLFPLYLSSLTFFLPPSLSFIFLSMFSISIPIPPLQPIPLYLPFLLISPSLLFHRQLCTICLTTPVYLSFLFSLHISLTSVSLCVTDNCSMMKIIQTSLYYLIFLFSLYYFLVSIFIHLFFPFYIN